MGLPGGKKGKTGAYATGAEVLEELAAQGHDLPARVLIRQLSKLKSTYTDALVEDINPRPAASTSYSMAGASTGRLSSNDPNFRTFRSAPRRGERSHRLSWRRRGMSCCP